MSATVAVDAGAGAKASDTMEACVLREFGGPERLRRERVARPVPGPGELLIRVRACGVCGHDLLARRGALGGTLPRILGHEIAGVVEQVGATVAGVAVGERVVLNQRRSCWNCSACRAGRPNHCTAGPGFLGEDLPGGYAEYVITGPAEVVRLPDEVGDAEAAVLPCGVVTALHALRRVRLEAGETVAVIGAAGGVGIHAVALARLSGARVVAVTRAQDKLDQLSAAGADVAVAAGGDTMVAAVREAVGGTVDAVVDCVGATVAQSVRLLRHGGRLAIVGNVDAAAVALQPGLLILKEIDVVGSSHGTPADLALAVELVRRGQIKPVVAGEVPLDGAAEAHRRLEGQGAVGRIVLQSV